jgi:hypothetical protein
MMAPWSPAKLINITFLRAPLAGPATQAAPFHCRIAPSIPIASPQLFSASPQNLNVALIGGVCLPKVTPTGTPAEILAIVAEARNGA